MFIAFEGIDGSGKTTLSNLLAQKLAARGLSVKHLRSEGKFASQVAESIRALGRDQRNMDLVPEAEFLLYVARDVQQMVEALKPALGNHDVVIADRFFYTAEVLGCSGRGLTREYVTPVLKAAQQGIAPDLNILVDVDPALGRARRKASKGAASDDRPSSRKGLTGTGLQQRLRKGYINLAEGDPERWVVVSNDRPIEQTVERLIALVEAAREEGAPPATQRFRKESADLSPKNTGSVPSVETALERFLGWVDERAEREPGVAAYLLTGFSGPRIDERRRLLAEKAPKNVLLGLRGLDDELSWELRHAFKGRSPELVVASVQGMWVDPVRADALRDELAELAPAETVRSTVHLETERAWALRSRFQAAHPDAVMASLAGLGSKEAWDVREAWLSSRWGILREDFTTARIVARSVSGVEGERAWALREAAHAMAPAAALSSVTGLVDEKAWQYRERHLRSATKLVMASLRGIDTELAWDMRTTVAKDCREALDGIPGTDRAEAWALRDECRDIWPSTVVKSLGILADTPRGQELVRRQLASYGHDLSLLKHAARIALGAHRSKVVEDAP